MKTNKRLSVFLAIVLAFSALSIGKAKPAYAGYWTTAYTVDITHWDPWWVPHYGAYFNGCEGSNQYFTGPSGAPADYSSWDWWGTCHYALLLSKTWLLLPSCWNPYINQWEICYDRWAGGFHNAYMLYH